MKIKTEKISKILSYIVTVAILFGAIYLGLWIIMGSSVLELRNIETGYYQQAIVHMMKIMPKKSKQITPSQAKEILNIYKEYLDILLPNFLTINL